MSELPVLVQRLHPDVQLPTYAYPGDAGADLVTTEAAELAPGERIVLPTGIAIALPEGYAAFVHPRSGLAARCGVALVNAPGTIDAGYRGEIKVIMVNLDPREPVRLAAGDRIGVRIWMKANVTTPIDLLYDNTSYPTELELNTE